MDALAFRADDGRGKTTKRPGELSSELSRGYPNGGTRSEQYRNTPMRIGEGTGGTETSKYPKEKKFKRFPE